MERVRLTLYLYTKFQTLVSKETFEFSEENLDKCFDRQVEWENQNLKNTSLLKREKENVI